MGYLGITKASNQVVCSGSAQVQELKIKTATNMYPGRLVKEGTNQDDIVVATASDNDQIGWLGYEQCNPTDQPADVDTIYTVSTVAPVLYGGGFTLVAKAAAGETITKGMKLCGKDAGCVGSATLGTDYDIIAIAEEDVTSGGSTADIIVRSLI